MNRNLDIVQRIVDSPRTIPLLLILYVLASTYVLASLPARTDAARVYSEVLGSSADVTCYSGGQVIYKGKSTGRAEATQSEGWEFQEAGTGKYIRVSGDCVVIN